MRRIHTRISWDIETGTVLEDEFFEYDGPVDECKGNDAAQQQQLSLQNSLTQQQLNQQNQLLGGVQSSLAPYTTAQGQGFTPQQMALMNSQAIDQNAAQYNGAGNQLRQQLEARGENGANPASGTYGAGSSALLSGKASDFANALRTNALANSQQALTNKFNANSVLSGNAQTLAGNVGTFNGGASSALNALTQQNIANQQNSLLANLSKGLGGGLAGLATIGLGSGLGGALSSLGKSGGGGSIVPFNSSSYQDF